MKHEMSLKTQDEDEDEQEAVFAREPFRQEDPDPEICLIRASGAAAPLIQTTERVDECVAFVHPYLTAVH